MKLRRLPSSDAAGPPAATATKNDRMKFIVSHVLVAMVSTAFAFFLFTRYYQPEPVVTPAQQAAQLVSRESVNPVNASPRAPIAELPVDFISVSRMVTDAVVNVVAYSATDYRLASGSGVMVSADGFIITNQHVIEDGSRYEITLHDKRTFEVSLVGIDRMTDLALLKVDEGHQFQSIRFGNSDEVQVGEWVLAVGNPFNLSSTVTAGIVSAKARSINILPGPYSIESFIQTDAVVNPGNSGGALVNTRGELVGINTAIISGTGGYEGYSFAIPANLVRKVVEDLREFGAVKRAILGVVIENVNDRIAEELDLPTVLGVYVSKVNQSSSAAAAGLKTGDVIVSINGVATNSVPELQEQVALFRPGDRVSVEFYRRGQRQRREQVVLQGLESSVSAN